MFAFKYGVGDCYAKSFATQNPGMSKQINPILTSTSSRFCCWEVLDKKAFGTFQQCFYLQLCWKWAAFDSLIVAHMIPLHQLSVFNFLLCHLCLGLFKDFGHRFEGCTFQARAAAVSRVLYVSGRLPASPPARLIVIWRDNICIQWPRLELTSNKNMVGCLSCPCAHRYE